MIEAVGEVAAATDAEAGRVLEIAAPMAAELAPGQSVAVDGACLTVRSRGERSFAVEVGASTLERTVAGRYAPGAKVNLERALRMGARLDGHLVQGHVDGLGVLLRRERAGDTRLLDFALPDEAFATTVLHGSIAISGISLTVNRLRADRSCQVAIIPHTWEHTNLPSLRPGDRVNVEADMIGKLVARQVAAHIGGSAAADAI